MVQHRMLQILAPRGHGKSTVIRAYVPWLLGRNPNLVVKLCAIDDELAMKQMHGMQQIMLSPRYSEVFPNIVPPGRMKATQAPRGWTKSQLTLERNVLRPDPTLECAGIGSSVVGNRAHWIIVDDAVGPTNIRTQGEINKVKELFWTGWWPMLEPDDRRVMATGTVWDKDDLNVQIMRDARFDHVFAAIDDDFATIWPEKWSREALIGEYEASPRWFARNYQNKPIQDDDLTFPERLLNSCRDPNLRFANEPIEGSLIWGPGDHREPHAYWSRCRRRFTGVDLAIAEGGRAAYTVIFTIGVDEGNIRYPLHIVRGRFSSPETARILYEVNAKFQPEVILVESNQYQKALIDWLGPDGVGESCPMPIRGHYTTKHNKFDMEVGINSLAVEFENRLWKLPFLDYYSIRERGAWARWWTEMISYPHSRYSDTVIAMWLAREAYRSVSYQNRLRVTEFSFGEGTDNSPKDHTTIFRI